MLRRAERLASLGIFDLIVINVYNTVIEVIGDRIRCVSMYSVEGYSKSPYVRRLSDEVVRNQYVYCTHCHEIFEDDTMIVAHKNCLDCIMDGVESPLMKTSGGTYKDAVEAVKKLPPREDLQA